MVFHMAEVVGKRCRLLGESLNGLSIAYHLIGNGNGVFCWVRNIGVGGGIDAIPRCCLWKRYDLQGLQDADNPCGEYLHRAYLWKPSSCMLEP